ncbi:hypothetical protein KI387_035234 [Taxus chinensis]|uniref:AMP-dependent synthetase/ligase domain-containing protein n=1 Tax=Taxus chinensis TaxID=29808 RepID=A0AA38KJ08_TAXCH|nr:hypothetical protein KI387_035234 [Taxus chinensis]
MWIGAIVTTTNPLNTSAEIGKQIADSKAKLAFVTPELATKFPGVTITQGYGLTETTGIGASTDTQDESRHYGTAGMLSPNTEAKVVDPDSGNPLPPNQRGELWLRGPFVMKGYFSNPEATISALDEDGWLRTGDLCYIDDEGYIFIVDRLKELIKYKGYQVAPAELEALLLSHPEISDVAVIPFPDKAAGQVPMAYVVRKPGSRLSEASIIEFVAQQVFESNGMHGGQAQMKLRVRSIKQLTFKAIGKGKDDSLVASHTPFISKNVSHNALHTSSPPPSLYVDDTLNEILAPKSFFDIDEALDSHDSTSLLTVECESHVPLSTSSNIVSNNKHDSSPSITSSPYNTSNASPITSPPITSSAPISSVPLASAPQPNNVSVGEGYVDWWTQQWVVNAMEEIVQVEEEVAVPMGEEAVPGGEGGDGGVAKIDQLHEKLDVMQQERDVVRQKAIGLR